MSSKHGKQLKSKAALKNVAEPRTTQQDDSDDFSFEEFSDEGAEQDEDQEVVPFEADGDENMQDKSQDLEEDDDESMSDYDPTRKDANEEELEKLVFGDSAGFRSALKGFGEDDDEPDLLQQQMQDTATTIPDGDLFFIDEGPNDALKPTPTQDLEDEEEERELPAWEDSDDERLQVSLMSVPRLRKLRNFEGEDVISGLEYQKRLRRQYHALHPPPKWSQWKPSTSERPNKRRKIDRYGGEGSSEDNASDVSTREDELRAPSLAALLKSSRPLVRQKPSPLSSTSYLPRMKPEVVDIDRLPDIVPTNASQPHATTCLSLHPALPLVISSGLSGMLYMHQIRPFPTPPDPPNPMITSLHMKRSPLSTAAFSPLAGTSNEPKIFMAANHRYFHTWTLPTGNISKTTRIENSLDGSQPKVRTIKPSPCGRWLGVRNTGKKGGGTVNILSAKSLQWIAEARGEGRGGLADFCWWSDGQGMSLVGKLGEVAEWSAEERRIIQRWQDQGGSGITVMTLGVDTEGVMDSKKRRKKHTQSRIGPDRWAILGTSPGFVTIHDRSKIAFKQGDKANGENGTTNGDADDADTGPPVITPEPHATLEHLTTPISHLDVSPCGQMLVIASKWKRDALRLVHLSSGTVYRNWPTAKTPIGRISSLTLGECEGVVQGSKDEDGRGLILIVGNEQGVIRNWVIRG